MPLRLVLVGSVVMGLVASIQAQSVEPFESWYEAEHATVATGATLSNYLESYENCGAGDWLLFRDMNFLSGEYTSFTAMADRSATGTIVLRLDSRTGTEIARVALTSGTTLQAYTAALSAVSGLHDLYVMFEGATNVCALNRFAFVGEFTVDGTRPVYHVSTATGSDQAGDGSLDRPFKTIAKASSVMKPGSTCKLRAGVYREILRPVYSGTISAPITYEAYGSELVYISAADLVTGWTKHTGNIYKAPMKWSMSSTDRNQAFVDGVGMYLARTPNVEGPCIQDEKYENDGSNPSTRCLDAFFDRCNPLLIPMLIGFGNCGTGVARGDAATTMPVCFSTYTNAGIGFANKPQDFFKGGVWLGYGTRYWSTQGRVLSSDATTDKTGRMVVGRYSGANMMSPHGGGGFVCDVFGLLDSPKEWFWDKSDSTMYLWTPASDDPTAHVVEAKRRVVVADLNSRNYIHLKNLRFLGGSMTMVNSENCLVEDCHFRYLAELYMVTFDEEMGANGYGCAYDPSSGYKGIYVSGENNTFRRSSFAVSAASLIVLDGKDQTIENCNIHDANYLGTYDAAIFVYNRRFSEDDPQGGLNCTGHKILHNSIWSSTRELIHMSTTGESAVNNPIKVQYNDFSYFMHNSYEGCGIYVYGDAAGGTDCSYNWFHSKGASGHSAGVGHDVGHRTPWYIHHNVYFLGKPTSARPIHAAFYTDTARNFMYNNTIVDQTEWLEPWDPLATHQWADGGDNILYAAGDTAFWKFTSPAESDFTLQANSPAVDAGRVLPGHLTTYSGTAPDLGAYERGEPRWVPGSNWKDPVWTFPPPPEGPAVASDRRVSAVAQTAPTFKATPAALHLWLPGGARYAVRITDAAGKLVLSTSRSTGGALSLPTRQFPSGVYFCTIQGNGLGSVRKFMVQR